MLNHVIFKHRESTTCNPGQPAFGDLTVDLVPNSKITPPSPLTTNHTALTMAVSVRTAPSNA